MKIFCVVLLVIFFAFGGSGCGIQQSIPPLALALTAANKVTLRSALVAAAAPVIVPVTASSPAQIPSSIMLLTGAALALGRRTANHTTT
jgi:hypothetical protein